jgi:hypothetical protein
MEKPIKIRKVSRLEHPKTTLTNENAARESGCHCDGIKSGNGRAIALALSSSGATVVCADLDKKARKEGYEEEIEIDTDYVIQLSRRQSPLHSNRRPASLRS